MPTSEVSPALYLNISREALLNQLMAGSMVLYLQIYPETGRRYSARDMLGGVIKIDLLPFLGEVFGTLVNMDISHCGSSRMGGNTLSTYKQNL